MPQPACSNTTKRTSEQAATSEQGELRAEPLERRHAQSKRADQWIFHPVGGESHRDGGGKREARRAQDAPPVALGGIDVHERPGGEIQIACARARDDLLSAHREEKGGFADCNRGSVLRARERRGHGARERVALRGVLSELLPKATRLRGVVVELFCRERRVRESVHTDETRHFES